MAETAEQPDAMFPELDAGQIARIQAVGRNRDVVAGEIIFELGSTDHGMFVVLEGSLDVVGAVHGKEEVLRIVRPGQFTGEVNQLSGRRSLVRLRARTELAD